MAHQTLMLRSFFRQFPEGKAPEAYCDFLRDSVTSLKDRFAGLFGQYPVEASRAQSEALQAELGKPEDVSFIRDRIAFAVAGSDNWVLPGGPPCQAYSLVGRSRNKGNPEYIPEQDNRRAWNAVAMRSIPATIG